VTPAERAAALTIADARRLDQCVAGGGVAVFPTDTVYGLGCDPQRAQAVARLYELKGRRPDKPAAVLFFALDAALGALPELCASERAAARALLPGPVTLLLPNRARRFPLACGTDVGTLGLRVPRVGGPLTALTAARLPLLQSSANASGHPEARRLCDVPAHIRDGADLALDGGELNGIASTVVDLTAFAADGSWHVARDGALPRADVGRALGGLTASRAGDPSSW
jgi:L-threonylcarbamoyladenylate synthase